MRLAVVLVAVAFFVAVADWVVAGLLATFAAGFVGTAVDDLAVGLLTGVVFFSVVGLAVAAVLDGALGLVAAIFLGGTVSVGFAAMV